MPTRTSCRATEHDLHRRTFLRSAVAGTTAALTFGGLAVGRESPQAARLRAKQKQVLFIWLAGGASQFEMWDPKPGRPTGGPFRAIPTSVCGTHFGELMPKTAKIADRLAVVRSLNTQITAHAIAADLISTGRPKEAALEYPEIGVVLAKQLARRDAELPDYVSIFLSSEGHRRPAVGFLGGRHAPLHLRDSLRPSYIDPPAGLDTQRHTEREHLRQLVSSQFARGRAGAEMVDGYNAAFSRVRGLMRSDHLFDLDREPSAMRERYGDTQFGRNCLLARRMLEAGVPMVKVARGFWDSHHDNFESHRELVTDFDHVFTTLIRDLEDRGLLDSTLVVVFSEFGRTPKINKDVGRDHYAAAWSCALAGCGIRGGVVHGKTDADGVSVADGEVDAADFAATVYSAVGIDPEEHYYVGPRPVPLAREDSHPIKTVLS
ncbi:MAG: DUF1501 domain-containing protein [Pirellulaceae bacterium]